MKPYLFMRETGFYVIDLKDDLDARANARLNPGTLRVLEAETMEPVWVDWNALKKEEVK